MASLARINASFFTGKAGFKGAQTPDFSFYRDAAGVSHIDGLTRNLYVVVKVCGCFSIFTKGAVHHH